MGAWLRRLMYLLRESRHDAELREEIEAHRELRAAHLEREGLTSQEAEDASRRAIGNVLLAREDAREVWLGSWGTVWQDVRYTLRTCRKNPMLTAVAVVTLALGIGANSAIFSVVNAVLIRPLPYPDAGRLVQVWETNPRANRWGDWASYPDFVDWRRENQAFEEMAAFRYWRFRLTGSQYPEMLVGLRVSPALFSVLGVNPMLGRPFLDEEGNEGRSDVAILSYGLWQRHFGSDPSLVGRTILIDGRSHLVVGVMPPGFSFPADIQAAGRVPDVWIPVGTDLARGSHNYRVIARLKSDRTIQQAQADMDRLVHVVAQLDAGHRGRGGMAAGLQQHTVAAVRPALVLLVGAIFLVLLIACANVASVLLARGAARQKEIAVRLALGAGRNRLLQQCLTESVVLALAGGAAGLLIAFASVRVLIELGPAVPLLEEASIDPRVLVFTFVTALTTGIAFGVAPTFQALKVSANEVLKESGQRHAGSAGYSRIRTVLTVGEISLALMLLIGAGLLVRSFVQLRDVDVGFDAENVLTAFLGAPPEIAADSARTAAFFQDVIARVGQIPGVRAAAGASAVPLLSNESSPFRVEAGSSSARGQELVYAEQPKITPGYFQTMGIRLMRGREFTGLDLSTSEPVSIVSESLAKTYWPGEDAIGKRVSIDDKQWRSVVGIVQDVRHDGLERPARPTVYIPVAQYPRALLTLLVRTDSNPESFITSMRRAVMDVDRNQPLFGIQTMEQTLSESVSLRRFLMILIVTFAGVAVVLGTGGVYGVLAYFVGERRQEIGIRMALGASRSGVVRLIVRQGARLALAGIVIGIAGALALSGALSGMLFGVSPTDLWTFSVIPALLFFVVLAASFLPARTAASVEPMIALRNQ
jgi:predicted permease